MLKLVKWIAIVVLLPLLVLKEMYEVFKESGFEISDPNDIINNIKNDTKPTDYSDKIDID